MISATVKNHTNARADRWAQPQLIAHKSILQPIRCGSCPSPNGSFMFVLLYSSIVLPPSITSPLLLVAGFQAGLLVDFILSQDVLKLNWTFPQVWRHLKSCTTNLIYGLQLIDRLLNQRLLLIILCKSNRYVDAHYFENSFTNLNLCSLWLRTHLLISSNAFKKSHLFATLVVRWDHRLPSIFSHLGLRLV